MKQITKLITIICLISILSNCSKCPDPSTKTSYVDRNYLPDIIPYSDTSTRLFLKNGKDTLLFKSQGLNQSWERGSTLTKTECDENYKNEKLLLRMFASDTDFFDIVYKTDYKDFKVGKFELKGFYNVSEFYYKDFRGIYKPITSINVLNNNYDSINIFPLSDVGTVYFKPKLGVIKIQTPKYTYEIIK